MTADYPVGYGKPPSNGRFKKGKSGNPKGRPKGSTSFKATFEEVLRQRIRVRQGDQQMWVPMGKAMLMALMNKGMQGNIRACEAIIKTAEKFGLVLPTSDTAKQDADKPSPFVWTEEDESMLPYIEHLLNGPERPLAEGEPRDAKDIGQGRDQNDPEPVPA